MTDCAGEVYMGNACPGGYTLTVWIRDFFGTYYVIVTFRDSASVDQITWRKNYGTTKPNCMAFSSESIAHLANEPASSCVSDGTAVLITAA